MPRRASRHFAAATPRRAIASRAFATSMMLFLIAITAFAFDMIFDISPIIFHYITPPALYYFFIDADFASQIFIHYATLRHASGHFATVFR